MDESNRYKFKGPGPGRPRGSKSKGAKIKDDFFNAYFKMGGKKWLLGFLADKRNAREFLFKVLPSLMPKKVDLEETVEVEHRLTPEMEELMRAFLEARRQIRALDIPQEGNVSRKSEKS